MPLSVGWTFWNFRADLFQRHCRCVQMLSCMLCKSILPSLTAPDWIMRHYWQLLARATVQLFSQICKTKILPSQRHKMVEGHHVDCMSDEEAHFAQTIIERVSG